MAKGEFDMLYLCAGGGGAMIFSFDKSTSLEGGGQKKKPWDYQGGSKKMKGKNKEIIIAHPLDKLWMLPHVNQCRVQLGTNEVVVVVVVAASIHYYSTETDITHIF